MKKRIFLLVMASVLAFSGCGSVGQLAEKLEKKSSEDVQEKDDLDSESHEGSTENGNSDVDVASESSEAPESGDGYEYEAQINEEVKAIVASAQDLTDELEQINNLNDKYDEMEQKAESQAEMDYLCVNGKLVWKAEAESLLERLKETEGASYDDIYAEYQNWEKYVKTMAERMSYIYEGGSIQGMIIMGNEAERYRSEAYTLASTLADLKGEVAFSFPTSVGPSGYYGDYASDNYLIVTESMESGSYDVLIHPEGSEEIRGSATEDEETGDLYFVSDDGNMSAFLSCWSLGAGVSVTESDKEAFTAGQSYEFTYRY